MADQEPLNTTSQDDDHLPERIRVHALAKRLGVTSKRILAKLSELGTEARSPQSSVDRAVAESVRDSLTTPPTPAEPALFDTSAPEPGPANAASGVSGEDAAEPGAAAEVASAAQAPAPGTGSGQIPGIGTEPPPAGTTVGEPADTGTVGQGPEPGIAIEASGEADTGTGEAAPAAGEPPAATGAAGPANTAVAVPAVVPPAGTGAPDTGVPGPATPPPAFTAATGLFASPVPEEPAAAEPVVFESAVVAAPLFLSPDAAAAEELRRRRKAEHEQESRGQTGAEDETDTETGADDQADQDDSDDQPRRRRRGRRGRGRGRGEQSSDADGDTEAEGAAESESEEAPAADTEEKSAEATETESGESEAGEDSDTGTSRRRRRRRRRKVAGESGDNEPADDDPPNTVVHEREPRNKTRARVDEVQGITGSTRLEAKRQRRRDGREAGRRRPPILTESEFLARREAVDRVMVVREKEFPGHSAATQVAVLEDNILVEHFVTSTGSASMVGNVYLGKVQNVLPSMEAAFVDIGRGRNGVLYAGEVNWEAAGLGGKERKIEQALKPGDQVLVQVSKDPVGHKGARLTTQISLAGRFLVYVPGGTSTGISRKLPDTERKRLKEILRDIVPADAGVIIRTASEGVSEAELTRDVERLQATWRKIAAAAEGRATAPKTLYEEPDLLVKVVRDLFNEDFSKLVIEGERSWTTVENYIGTVAPDLLARVSRHENNGADVFETYRIDEQLAKALDRKVWLPSGGTLVIDRTEAMTVIDVNTGKFTGSGGGNLEETVTRNNLEAAEEIVRQMRLRDIGGMIVVDFIDMVLESNRDLVLRRLTEALGRDRTRHQVSEVTSLGLVQMTRKKLGTGLVEAFSTTCEHCHGRGLLVHSYPVEAAGAEEPAGRGRETGSRRRRSRDKAAVPAPAPAAAPAAPEVAEEDAAAKRAHPVALAMAAHQTDEAAGDVEAASETADRDGVPASAEASAELAAAGDTPAADSAFGAGATPDGSARTVADETGAAAKAPEPRRRRTRVRRSAGAAASGDERPAAELNGSGAHAEAAVASDSAQPAPATPGEAPEQPAAPEVTEPVAATGPETDASPATAASETTVDKDAGARNGVPDAPAEIVEDRQTTPEPAPEAGDGVSPARARRRRVARSTSAPAADSTGTVFVLSAQEQPSAPVADFSAETPEIDLPARRVRRRAAGRPAGPPADEQQN